MTPATIHERFQQKKVCVLVPTYNNAQTLAQVLNAILEYTSHVIVVNDGSTDDTPAILAKFPGIQRMGYAHNKGKGFALRQGFAAAVAAGYEYAITMDSDGQHFADDLPLFLDALEVHPGAIIIGTRNMDQATVPGKSNFGNRFSNFWFWVETGIYRNDTQSGYRLYPVRLLSEINFITRKFEFEIEVLVRGAWHGIDVTEIPVKVFYPEKGQRITHFRPFRDFTRITILNTFFVLIAFFYIKPRDLFRYIKKKNSVSSSAKTFSTPTNLTETKPFR